MVALVVGEPSILYPPSSDNQLKLLTRVRGSLMELEDAWLALSTLILPWLCTHLVAPKGTKFLLCLADVQKLHRNVKEAQWT